VFVYAYREPAISNGDIVYISAEPCSDDVPVPTLGPRIVVCARCGIVGADARPNWRKRPERPSLTGAQRR
jgi:hypothetical protein